MIREISIKNIALIDSLTIGFDEGFNVLTGETGAGKSIIIDSVNLALGERADRELIQTGKDFARVEVLFSLTNSGKINEILNEYGITPEEDNSLLIMRELTSQGKNLCKINGRSVTLSMLREISKHLVDVHGQHQHQSLLSPESHVSFLDRLGGTELSELKSDLRQAYMSWQNVNKEISKIMGLNKDGERRRDILKYQIDEIENASLKPGEEEELRKERTILLNAEKIATIVNDSYNILYSGGKGFQPVMDGLSEVVGQLRSIQGIDQLLDDIAERLENLQYTMEDAVQDLRVYRDRFEYDPDRLEQIENRLNEILVLKRKYGSTIEEILSLKAEMEAELDVIDNSQEKLEALYKEYRVKYKEVLKLCRKLTQMRQKWASFLEDELTRELAYLNMSKTVFQVNIVSPDFNPDMETEVTGITENGWDTVEFLISPNPGEPLKPLSKIISGGEMSRLMLAFKSILGELDEIPTMIFDEIDVGISGRTAQKVAEKMGSIARSRQVICVTHLPQIASMADSHFIIEKTESAGHTRTNVKKLEFSERKYEIARMIGGANLTRLSLEHAGELLESAMQHKGLYIQKTL